ncbi:MAG: cytochrome c biogenesis protein CcdC [Alicyclobacillaceae bacterium]|nr:cytochrome c biogenesis protein CcdC [Alicyclobacillaceae bacterium]
MGHAALNIQTTATLGAVLMALMVIAIRLRAANRPTSIKKIVLPPLGMTTGFLMFLFPQTHIPVSWGIGAFAAGALFLSYPLIRTSKFQIIEGQIYLKRSKAFVLILLGLLAVRLLLHSYVEHYITLPQTGAVFFLLAYGMIVPWRVAMVIEYRKTEEQWNRYRRLKEGGERALPED